MIWHFLRYCLTFFFPVFYRRIQGRNIRHLQVRGPAVIAMNHPNAFTDPILITYLSYPERMSYMARGDAFKPGLIAWLLSQLGIIPVFRIQDAGKEGLKLNDESYRMVNRLLRKGKKVIVFAEGLCIQERRLRPLKKGVARMVFQALEFPELKDLKVIPVGVNYSCPHKFRSDVFYNVGQPIDAASFAASTEGSSARMQSIFLRALEDAMKPLVTHIDDPANDRFVEQAEMLVMEERLQKKGIRRPLLEDEFLVTQALTNGINQGAQDDVSAARESAARYFDSLRECHIEDRTMRSLQKPMPGIRTIVKLAILLVLLPAYLMALLIHAGPALLTHKLAKNILKQREFYSSIALATGMVIFIFTYVLLFAIVYALSPNIFFPIGAVFLSVACGAISLWYHPLLITTLQSLRLLANQKMLKDLRDKRAAAVAQVNIF